ncbi:MAG: FtsQ-type POTRA domain-containing protein [Lentisphaerae bacterium]|nr:FtsQ-type POTRA domain-containing protein [Lentisphaerota bacterium]
MLFEDQDIFGPRLRRPARGRRRKPVLNVRARSRASRRSRVYHAAVFVLVPAVLAAATVLAWFGLQWTGRLLFSRNDRFTVRHLDIAPGRVITEPLIREYTGLHEGMNLFAADIASIRRGFLRRTPVVKAMTVARLLPDTLQVAVTERQAVARLGRRGTLVTDGSGMVFSQHTGKKYLPVLIGLDGSQLRPGRRFGGLALDAARVLDMCERTGLDREVIITAIDVRGNFSGREQALRLYLAGGTTVDLWWVRGEADGTAPAEDLQARLVFLRGLMRRAAKEQKPVQTVNLTLDDFENNCPITPRW